MQTNFDLLLLLAWFILPLMIFFYQGIKAMLKTKSEYNRLRQLELEDTYSIMRNTKD